MLKIIGSSLERNIKEAEKQVANSLEKLSSGIQFSSQEPKPAERALSDKLSLKIKETNSAKRNINDGLSLVQTADGALNEVGNIIVRMKELVTQSMSPVLSDKERVFAFHEYQALYKEVERIGSDTSFNGVKLLNGNSDLSKQSVVLSAQGDSGSDESLKRISLLEDNEGNIVKIHPESLGLISAESLLSQSNEGISVDDIQDHFSSSDGETLSSFQDALSASGALRAQFGAAQSRLQHALNVTEITQENVEAARSRIRDTDYALETANLAKAKLLLNVGTKLLAEQNELKSEMILSLFKNDQ